MARFELKLPKMGESVAEATVTSWLKNVGDTIVADEAVLEIATDKVDSEVPSEVDGTLLEVLFEVDDVVQVGQTLAIIETDADVAVPAPSESDSVEETQPDLVEKIEDTPAVADDSTISTIESSEGRFYSPLVKKIAAAEGISQSELDVIPGTGKNGRVTKNDMLGYLKNRGSKTVVSTTISEKSEVKQSVTKPVTTISVNGEDEIIEMTRMGKLIAHHMVESVQTSAHVQSFIECDVTNIWNWRNKIKNDYEKREGEKLTLTPIFMEAVAKALRDFPMLNISVEGNTIIKHKNINLGMAAALADGNLIVPVIRNADQLNLVGMSKAVNDLAGRARTNRLKPDEIQG